MANKQVNTSLVGTYRYENGRLVPVTKGQQNFFGTTETPAAPTSTGWYFDQKTGGLTRDKTDYRLPSMYDRYTDANAALTDWGRRGYALDGFGRADASSGGQRGNWWEHPASALYAGGGAQGLQAPAGWTGSSEGWARYYNSLNKDQRDAYVQNWTNQTNAQNSRNTELERIAGSLDSAQAGAENKLGTAISNYQSSDAGRYLSQMADPNYKAVSDEFVSGQKQAAGQLIAKAQADAVNASIDQVTRRGLQGGPLSLQMRVAAGWRAAADKAQTNAAIDQRALDTNIKSREWATGQLSARDAVVADLEARRGEIATKFEPLKAQILSGKTFDSPDFTEAWLQTWSDDLTQLEDASVDEMNQLLDVVREQVASSTALMEDEKARRDAEEQLNRLYDDVAAGLGIGEFLMRAIQFMGLIF